MVGAGFIGDAMNYPQKWVYDVRRVDHKREAILSVLLACAIGVGLALALVSWWSS